MLDYHIHSNTSSDSQMEVKKIIETAKSRGLKFICITNHYEPWEVKHDDYHQSFTPAEATQYKKEIEDNSSEDIDVSFGVELSYTQEEENEIEDFIKNNDFDYIIGSVHYIEKIKVADRKNKNKFSKNAIEKYFESVKNAIKTEQFDIIGHLDIYRRCISEAKFEEVKHHYEEIAELMIKHNTGFEINTSRYKEAEDDFYPTRSVIEILVNKGVKKITIGSDSHKYEYIGANYERATEFLKSIEITEIYYFKKRKAITFKI